MKVITNIGDTLISIGFEGWNYLIPAKEKVMVDDSLAMFLHETYPLLPMTEIPKGKEGEKLTKVQRTPTRVFITPRPDSDMKVSKSYVKDDTLNNEEVDGLPKSGSIDKDGMEWTGEGVESDTIS